MHIRLILYINILLSEILFLLENTEINKIKQGKSV